MRPANLNREMQDLESAHEHHSTPMYTCVIHNILCTKLNDNTEIKNLQ